MKKLRLIIELKLKEELEGCSIVKEFMTTDQKKFILKNPLLSI